MDYIRAIERQQIREDIPAIKVGDHVKVHYRIVEGERTREQVFEGDVIRMSGEGARETSRLVKASLEDLEPSLGRLHLFGVTSRGKRHDASHERPRGGCRPFSLLD